MLEKLHEVDQLSPLEKLENEKNEEIDSVVEWTTQEMEAFQQSIDPERLTIGELINKIWDAFTESEPWEYTDEKKIEYKSHRFLRMWNPKIIEYNGHEYRKIEMTMSKIVDEGWTWDPYEIHVQYKKDWDSKDYYIKKWEKNWRVVVYFMDNNVSPKEYLPYYEDHMPQRIKKTLTDIYVLIQKIKWKKVVAGS